MHGNRLNLEDNSEAVKIGKAVHEEREEKAKNAELQIENIKIDALTDKYLVEIKKSDADVEASQWQLLLYLKILKEKGIERIGKLEFVEKNKQKKNVILVELTEEKEQKLEQYIAQITDLINGDEIRRFRIKHHVNHVHIMNIAMYRRKQNGKYKIYFIKR